MGALTNEQREMLAGMYHQALVTYSSGTFTEVTMQRSIDLIKEFSSESSVSHMSPMP